MINLATTERQFLRTDEVCALFHVARRTVYYWRVHGKIPYVRVGGTIVFPVAGVRQLVAMVEERAQISAKPNHPLPPAT